MRYNYNLLQIRIYLEHCTRAEYLEGLLVKTSLHKFVSDESGVTAIEYGVISALIAVVIIGAVGSVGTHLRTTFQSVAASL